MITVDLLVVGKREVDERVKIEATSAADRMQQARILKREQKGSGFASATGSFVDPDLRQKNLQ